MSQNGRSGADKITAATPLEQKKAARKKEIGKYERHFVLRHANKEDFTDSKGYQIMPMIELISRKRPEIEKDLDEKVFNIKFVLGDSKR